MSEWKKYKLGDLCTSQNGYAFKSSSFCSQGEINVIKIKELKNGLVDFSEDTAKVEKQQELYKFIVNKGDIIFALTGDPITKPNPGSWVGRVSLYNHQEPAYLNQRVGRIICGADIDNLYLYYYFRWFPTFKTLASKAKGSASQANISLNDILETAIKLPSLIEQRRISSFLSSLDDKIAVNKKICENLEAQAQALFKHWFVDFAPFKHGKFVESELGLIPEGWRVVSLAELMDYAGGSQPPASEFIDEEREGYIRFVQIRDYASDSHITYIPESKKNKLCDVKDIMIARYGVSLGRICYGLKGAYNVALAKVFPTKDYYLEFLRCYLNTMEFYIGINMKGNRAVQAGFNKSDIQSFKLPFPNDESIVLSFNEICSSLFEKRLSSEQESRHLATLRDTLLPKLMSGQIKV